MFSNLANSTFPVLHSVRKIFYSELADFNACPCCLLHIPDPLRSASNSLHRNYNGVKRSAAAMALLSDAPVLYRDVSLMTEAVE